LVAVAVVGLLAWFPIVAGTRVPLLGYFDLGMHELGHMLTFPLPQPLTAFAGSLTQVLVPLGLAGYFLLWRGERTSAAVCVAWGGANLYDVAVYVADAPYQRLPLLGGDNVDHDWAYLLGPEVMNAMSGANELATALRVLGIAAFVGAVVVALWAVPRRTWRWLGG
jgi:hypothetical protein